jgi:DNA-binding MarR family transcriptional regulator
MKTSLLSSHQLDSWLSYQRMRVRLADRINREISRSCGVSEADFDILMALLESPQGPMRALELRCGLEWEKSRLSHQLRRMEQRGLVRREICVEDNRSAVIVLTDTGRDLAETARRAHDDAVRAHVFDVLTPEQLAALEEISGTILAGLGPGQHEP